MRKERLSPQIRSFFRRALSLFACLGLCMCSYAQYFSENVFFSVNSDSLLVSYSKSVLKEAYNERYLPMSDTLYHMAEEQNDVPMMLVALSNKVDYYYFRSDNEDSLFYYLDRTMSMAKENNMQPEYYFIWGKRKIAYYVRNNFYNIALSEAEKMLEEARDQGNTDGLINAYATVGSIYARWQLYPMAIDAIEGELNVLREFKGDTDNLSAIYSRLARLYITVANYDKARETLKLCYETIRTDWHRYYYYLRLSELYLACDADVLAQENLALAKRLLDESPSLYRASGTYYASMVVFYDSTRQYKKAIDILESSSEHPLFSPYEDLLHRAELYEKVGKYKTATRYYRNLCLLSDSIHSNNADRAVNEFGVLLGVNQLEETNTRLQESIDSTNFNHRLIFVIIIVLFLIVVCVFLYIEHRAHSRLKKAYRVVTEAKDLAEDAREKMEQTNHMKSEFIRNMSHEIRTPLNAIAGFSQLLSSTTHVSPETQKYAEIISKNTDDLLHLLENIMDLSDLRSGADILTNIEVEATSLCKEVVAAFQDYLLPGVEMRLAIPEGVKYYFHSNPDRIRQVLSQLLENATKFTQVGFIELNWTYDYEGHNVIFTVTDTGPGIPNDKREDLFEQFKNEDPFSQGAGLSLSLCYILVERLGGHLLYDEQYDCGSRFIIKLPADK